MSRQMVFNHWVSNSPNVAAGIADAPMTKTTLTACRLALITFIVPYMFVYNNAVLLVGMVIVAALLGIRAPGLLRRFTVERFKSQDSAPVPGGK